MRAADGAVSERIFDQCLATYNWSFPGGLPAISSQANPTVIYQTPGAYSATLTVTNAVGSNTITKTNYVVVSTTPTVGFGSAVNGLTVNFTNTSTGASSYLWEFGDGSTSAVTNPVHTYAQGGSVQRQRWPPTPVARR